MKIARATRASLGLATLVTLIIASTIRAQARKSALDVPQTQQQNSLLYDLLPKNDEERHTAALEEIEQRGDKSYIAPLIDLLLFFTSPDDSAAILNTLDQLTGQNWDGSADPWSQLCVWYAEHPELRPPAGYTGWKGEMYAQMSDPRFRDFLYDGEPANLRVEEVVWGGVKVEGIPALVNPRMLPAAQANYLTDSEPVFGVSIHGDNRAYPLRIMDWHEIANDIVGGTHVALTYSPLCGSAILYETGADGRNFVLATSGLLFRSNKLMYDRETNTLWSQMTGKPVLGKLAGSGAQLKVLPIVVTSWGEWRKEHADTKVLDINTGFRRTYKIGAAYGRYFASPDLMFPVGQESKLLPRKALVFAVEENGGAKAYPLEALNCAGGVANDNAGSIPLVVIYHGATQRVPLPPDWLAALRDVTSGKSRAAYANDLSLEDVRGVLNKNPALIKEMNANFLLAIPGDARLSLLSERTPNARTGSQAGEGQFTPDLRNEVAQRGLIGETRAYERGAHSFRAGAGANELIDEHGGKWRVSEDALISDSGEQLHRVAGHLSYWAGWFAFYPKTEIYQCPSGK
jgi:uncharacterized protein DUF3179